MFLFFFFWKSEDTTISFWDFLTFKGPEEPVEVINEEGEEDLEGTEDAGYGKYEEPKQITVQIEEQSRRPRKSCNKNLFESKSMTNLKPERLSMKRRHRFSGNNQNTYANFCFAIYVKQTFDKTLKCQVISERNFGVLKLSKKPTKFW